DTLVGFWAVGEKPTGSKDPFALRRAALGIIRLVLDNNLRLRLAEVMPAATLAYMIWGFHPLRDFAHGGYRDLIGQKIEGGSVTGGDWHKLPYRLFLNYDGFVDQKGELAGEAEIEVYEDDDAEE